MEFGITEKVSLHEVGWPASCVVIYQEAAVTKTCAEKDNIEKVGFLIDSNRFFG